MKSLSSMSSIGSIVTFLILCCGSFIFLPCATAANKGSSDHRMVSLSKAEEPKVYGVFQKYGGLAEAIALPKGSSPSSATDATSTTATQLPLQAASMRRRVSHKVASFLTVCWFGSLFYCWKFVDSWKNESNAPVFLLLSVVLYFFEAANSSTARYLRNSLTPDGVDEYLESIKAVIPRVVWDIECFHYRNAQHVQFSSNKNGRNGGRNNQHTSTDKVVTHRASAEYAFENCKDETDTRSLSRVLNNGGGGGGDSTQDSSSSTRRSSSSSSLPKQFTKITLDKLLLFANDATYNGYVEQESRFRYLHQNRDVHHTFLCRLEMDGYLPKILVVNHNLGGAGTGMMNHQWYWIFTSIGMTVAYRIWFSRHCSNTEVTITKEVKGSMFPTR